MQRIARVLAISSVLLAGLLVDSGGVPSAGAAAPPKLTFTRAPGHPLAVRGTGWKGGERIVLSLQLATVMTGIQLRATARGSFTVAIGAVTLCGASQITARAYGGSQATIVGPARNCALQGKPPRPRFSVLAGTRLRTRTVTVVGLGGSRSVSLRVGEKLYFSEPSVGVMYVPSVDRAYLTLLRHRTAVQQCANGSCIEQTSWEWVTVKAGETAIDLAAPCRQSRPPCMLPDRLVRVRITA